MAGRDPDDAHQLALALVLGLPLWSNFRGPSGDISHLDRLNLGLGLRNRSPSLSDGLQMVRQGFPKPQEGFFGRLPE